MCWIPTEQSWTESPRQAAEKRERRVQLTCRHRDPGGCRGPAAPREGAATWQRGWWEAGTWGGGSLGTPFTAPLGIGAGLLWGECRGADPLHPELTWCPGPRGHSRGWPAPPQGAPGCWRRSPWSEAARAPGSCLQGPGHLSDWPRSRGREGAERALTTVRGSSAAPPPPPTSEPPAHPALPVSCSGSAWELHAWAATGAGLTRRPDAAWSIVQPTLPQRTRRLLADPCPIPGRSHRASSRPRAAPLPSPLKGARLPSWSVPGEARGSGREHRLSPPRQHLQSALVSTLSSRRRPQPHPGKQGEAVLCPLLQLGKLRLGAGEGQGRGSPVSASGVVQGRQRSASC